jgi:hypothetical protein
MEDRFPGFDVATADPLANARGYLVQFIQVKYSEISKLDIDHTQALKKLLKAQAEFKNKNKDGQTLHLFLFNFLRFQEIIFAVIHCRYRCCPRASCLCASSPAH